MSFFLSLTWEYSHPSSLSHYRRLWRKAYGGSDERWVYLQGIVSYSWIFAMFVAQEFCTIPENSQYIHLFPIPWKGHWKFGGRRGEGQGQWGWESEPKTFQWEGSGFFWNNTLYYLWTLLYFVWLNSHFILATSHYRKISFIPFKFYFLFLNLNHCWFAPLRVSVCAFLGCPGSWVQDEGEYLWLPWEQKDSIPPNHNGTAETYCTS